MHRLPAFLLALLTLFGALHDGVHLLEHAQHDGPRPCLHAHASDQQAAGFLVDSELHGLAVAHPAGDTHFCPVCFTSQTNGSRSQPADVLLRLPTEAAIRPDASVCWSRLGGALPPSRGPPLS
jgi:hypothetical protein